MLNARKPRAQPALPPPAAFIDVLQAIVDKVSQTGWTPYAKARLLKSIGLTHQIEGRKKLALDTFEAAAATYGRAGVGRNIKALRRELAK